MRTTTREAITISREIPQAVLGRDDLAAPFWLYLLARSIDDTGSGHVPVDKLVEKIASLADGPAADLDHLIDYGIGRFWTWAAQGGAEGSLFLYGQRRIAQAMNIKLPKKKERKRKAAAIPVSAIYNMRGFAAVLEAIGGAHGQAS